MTQVTSPRETTAGGSAGAQRAQETRQSPRESARRRPRRPIRLLPWVFLAPALLVFAYFKFLPMGQAIFLGFFDVGIRGDRTWVGFANFERAVNDPDVWRAFWHTVVYVVVTVPLSAGLGFALALLLQRQARRIRFIRTAVFLPVVAAVAVVAEIWRIIYFAGDDGLLNRIFGLFGMGPSGFLSDPDTALTAIMAVQIWKSVPYDMVILVAGLAAISRDLYEAAAIDGAGWWARTRYVTVPELRPVFVIVITLGLIRGFRVFTEVYVLTGGGPAGSTDVLLTYTYRMGLERLDLGYGSAVATMVFGLTAILTAVYLWRQRRRGNV